jgi:hypothetical protein
MSAAKSGMASLHGIPHSASLHAGYAGFGAWGDVVKAR